MTGTILSAWTSSRGPKAEVVLVADEDEGQVERGPEVLTADALNFLKPDSGRRISLADADNPTKNPEHLGNIPAGAARDEERARRADVNARTAEMLNEDSVAFDPAKFRIENEFGQWVEQESGDVIIKDARPDRHYAWLHADDISHQRASRVLHNPQTGRSIGYTLVQGDDKEAWEFRGHDAAGGTTNRGLIDDLLYWMPMDDWLFYNRYMQFKALRPMLEGPENAFEDAGIPGASHGRRDNPVLRRTILSGTRGQVVRAIYQLQHGQLPGLRPGDDVRARSNR